MILFVSNSKRFNSPFCADFISPRQWKLTPSTETWAADNDAFNGFSETRFLKLLDTAASHPVKPKFITCPDVVCDYRATADLWRKWCSEFKQRQIPLGYVLQDGIEEHPPEFAIPWSGVNALFIGGSDKFKLGRWVAWMTAFARHRGIWVHMGRVNSVKRLNHARRIGCHSADGSGMAKYSNAVLRPMLNSLHQEQQFLHL